MSGSLRKPHPCDVHAVASRVNIKILKPNLHRGDGKLRRCFCPRTLKSIGQRHGATFIVERDGLEVNRFEADFTATAELEREVRHTFAVMSERSRLATLDRGSENNLQQLVDRAPQPGAINVVLDSGSGDTTVLYQFTNRAPVAVRLSPEMVGNARERLAAEARRRAH